MSKFRHNGHTFFEYLMHACDNSRPVQPLRGPPIPWSSLEDTLDVLDGPKCDILERTSLTF